MKKILVSFLLLTLHSVAAYESYAALRISGGSFTDQIIEEIYPHWYPSIGGELGVFYAPALCFSVGYSYMHTNGHSVILGQPNVFVATHNTEITIQNLDFVVHWYFRSHKAIRPHIGIGPRIFFVSIYDESPFVVGHPTQNSLGGVVKGGLCFEKGSFFLDPFIEYGFARVNFYNHGSSINYPALLNNFNLGIGIGVKL